jgi:hypothetical protein
MSLATDASDTGWGYVLQGLVRKGIWSADQLCLPIGIKELMAAEKALRDNKEIVTAQNILWEVDSQKVLLYWWNQGSIKNVPLSPNLGPASLVSGKGNVSCHQVGQV